MRKVLANLYLLSAQGPFEASNGHVSVFQSTNVKAVLVNLVDSPSTLVIKVSVLIIAVPAGSRILSVDLFGIYLAEADSFCWRRRGGYNETHPLLWWQLRIGRVLVLVFIIPFALCKHLFVGCIDQNCHVGRIMEE